MAEEGTHWSFELVDGVSKSASAMSAAVKGLEQTVQGADGKFREASGHMGQQAESSFGGMQESVKSFAEGFFFITEDIERACDFLERQWDRLKEVAEKAFDVGEFRRNALIGLDAMLATGYQANDVLERLEGWAKQTGMAKDTFAMFGKQLLGEGFHEGELKPLLAALSDVQAVNGGKVEASQQLLEVLGRIRATDRLSARELAQFGQLGIKPEGIYEAYAAANKTTVAQAKALFGGGEVKGTKALQAIIDSIGKGIDKGGPLGKMGQTWELGSIPAQVQKAKDAIDTLFEGVDTKPFALGIAHLTAQLSGPSAARFADAISVAFEKVGDWVGRIDLSKVGVWIDRISGALEKATVVGGQFFSGLEDGWNDMKGPIEGLGGTIGSIFGSDGTSSVRLFAQSLGDVVGGFVLVGEAVIALVGFFAVGVVKVGEAIGWLATAPEELGEAIGRGLNEFQAFGVNLVEGLWTGITSAWSGLLSKFHALLGELPESVKHVLGIASPSRVFAGLGVHTMEGFALGLRSVDVEEHVMRAVAPPTAASLRAEMGGGFRPNARSLGDFGGGGVGRKEVSVSLSAPMHFDGSRDPEATASAVTSELRRVLLPELVTAIEQLAIETGA